MTIIMSTHRLFGASKVADFDMYVWGFVDDDNLGILFINYASPQFMPWAW